jgi:hypothetical protein
MSIAVFSDVATLVIFDTLPVKASQPEASLACMWQHAAQSAGEQVPKLRE